MKPITIHPGYVFISEDSEMASKVISDGLSFTGHVSSDFNTMPSGRDGNLKAVRHLHLLSRGALIAAVFGLAAQAVFLLHYIKLVGIN
ncbi:MAG: hypothetical protein KDD53_04505 [Bdellovibrionales bacterium]|nr:hypothetical protein [Bdellovibrionales bacterium]